MLKLSTVGLCLALAASCITTAQADQSSAMVFYRYVDNRGVTVLDRQVPAEYSGKGYEVLNQRGRVIQVVPPAPTEEEARAAQAAKAQADADAQLLHLYSSVADVDRARMRKLSELDTLISVAQGNIKGLINQQSFLQGQAADQERAGRPVPQTLIDQMNDVKDQQQNIKADIQRYQASRDQAEVEFAQYKTRVQKLLSQ